MTSSAVPSSCSALSSATGRYVLNDGSHLNIVAVNGSLVAEAVGQQAYQLLATGDTLSAARSAEYNAKSRAIVERLLQGDIRPLRTALGPAGDDSATVATQESQLLAFRKETFGDFKSIEVLGTAPGPEGGLRTVVRVNYARGGATNLYTWDRNGAIMDIGAKPYKPIELSADASGDLRAKSEGMNGGAQLRVINGSLNAITPRGVVSLLRVNQ